MLWLSGPGTEQSQLRCRCEQGSKSPINVDALFKQAAAKYSGSAEPHKPAETSKPAEAGEPIDSSETTEPVVVENASASGALLLSILSH